MLPNSLMRSIITDNFSVTTGQTPYSNYMPVRQIPLLAILMSNVMLVLLLGLGLGFVTVGLVTLLLNLNNLNANLEVYRRLFPKVFNRIGRSIHCERRAG